MDQGSQLTTSPLPIVAIVGPTASGKTALSLALAQALGGPSAVEIVSADAMQLYIGMDIGTAKAPLQERQGVEHHQIDVLNVTQEASVAAYQREARRDIDTIRSRGKYPILVGGSGLYVAGVLDELDFPGTDAKLRAHLEQRWHKEGLESLVRDLREMDPVSAQRIDTENPRRVVRALEVVTLTGRSYTPVFPRHTNHYAKVIHIGVQVETSLLHERIRQRTEDMFAQGLVEETRALIDQGLRSGPTASKATGYAQALSVIDGSSSVEEAVEATALATRRLAKKQRTWFRADHRIEWIEITDSRSLNRAALHLARTAQALSLSEL